LYPQGENADNWQQKIDTYRRSYKKMPAMNALQLAKDQIYSMSQNCGKAKHEIMYLSQHAILYTLSISDCSRGEDSQQIAKLFNGVDGVYMIRYSARPGMHQQYDH